MATRDLATDARSYAGKHMDELRAIQSNIEIQCHEKPGPYQSKKDIKDEIRETVQPVVGIVLSFIRSKGYSSDDTHDIINALGLSMPSSYERLVKSGVSIELSKKATKKQEVKQYPPRYTTSKPIVQADITSTYKPKLNLRHIQQVDQPPSVSPSENTRKAKLTVSGSESHSIPKQSAHKKAYGQIEGLEEDDRIWNTEKDMYIRALGKVGNNLPQPNPRIHATNDVRAAVRRLPNGSQLANRLRAWR